MDVSKVRLRVKKADGDYVKAAPEPRTRDRRKAEVSEEADSSLGPINLSIKKSGKTNVDYEGGKRPAYELMKEKPFEKRAEKRAMLRNEGKETNSKKSRIKETVPSVEKQDGKKDKDVKKTEKVSKSTEKVSKSRVKKEQKAAKENKETLTKIHNGSEEDKRADLQKRQQNQRMEKELKAKKQKEEEERRERKDERLERVKKEKEQKQREEVERREVEHQEKERIERELREKMLKQKEQEDMIERERIEKERRQKERKEEEKQRETERLERELKAQELKEKKEEARREREMREQELKEEEELRERERLEKETKLLKNYVREREVQNVTGLKKALAKKTTTQKQTGAINCDDLEASQNHEEAEPKITKRKAGHASCPQEKNSKRRKLKAANSPCTRMVKKSKGKGRQSKKTNKSLIGAKVSSTCMETDEAAKALELSSVPEKLSSPVKEKMSQASEELSITKNLSDKVRSMKATSEGKDTMEAQTSSDLDSGTDSPTLDLSKPPCSKSQEGEDDEGIHSHDGGSDISDCVSEVSYDSGLNGKLPETPTEELPTPTQLLSHTCVFCDRTFLLEMDYRRHLNRHLVNVYYLDNATKHNK